MTTEPALRVFFEPKIAAHTPELYAFEHVDHGIDAADLASEEALELYRRNGFLMVRGLLDQTVVADTKAELESMALSDRPECGMLWYEGALRDHLALDASRDREPDVKSTTGFFSIGQQDSALPRLDPAFRARFVRKFMHFVDRAPALTRLARHPEMLAAIERLIGGTPELFQDMALVKPGKGREKPWHQDHAYFNVAIDTPICGVWIPMGRVTPENGCMHMLSGGHVAGPRPHFKRRDWQICDTDIPTDARVAVPMQAGDVLFFDGKIPHGTPTNQTDQFRWAVQYHYRPTDSTLVADEVRLAAFGNEGRDVTC